MTSNHGMTKDQIMAQLSVLVDAYIVLNDDEGDGPATTADFILATQISLEDASTFDQIDVQEIIDNMAPVSVEQTPAGDSTDQDEATAISVGDEVQVVGGRFIDRYGEVRAVDPEDGIVCVFLPDDDVYFTPAAPAEYTVLSVSDVVVI